MKRKARELQHAKREAKRSGGGRPGYSGGFAGGFGSSDVGRGAIVTAADSHSSYDMPKPSYNAPM